MTFFGLGGTAGPTFLTRPGGFGDRSRWFISWRCASCWSKSSIAVSIVYSRIWKLMTGECNDCSAQVNQGNMSVTKLELIGCVCVIRAIVVLLIEELLRN